MIEHQPFNRLPLEQVCKAKLLEAKAEYDPQYPYSLQLALWLIESHPDQIPGPADRYRDGLEVMTGELLGWKELDQARRLMLNPASGQEPKLVNPSSLPESKLDPIALARNLVETLYDNLQERMPSLRVPSL